MAAFTRTHSDATWTNGGLGNYVTVIADWQSLADKTFKSLNGDLGGTWIPSSPITIDTGGMNVTGPALVSYGGTLTTLSGARFVLGVGDWPKLSTSHVGRTRVIQQEISARQSTPRYWWCDAPAYPGSIQSIACTLVGPYGIEQPACIIPLRVHDGARLTQATVTFRIPSARTAAPIGLPKMRIVRVDVDGAIVPMSSVSSGADATGFQSPSAPASATAWYANGGTQTWTVTCDQNNTIDTSLYTYFAELVEEVGTKDPTAKIDGAVVRERKLNVAQVFVGGAFTPFGPQGTVPTGGRALATGQPSPFEEYGGIWVVDRTVSTAWARSIDLSKASDFTPGFLVLADGSISDLPNNFMMWESVAPIFGQNITLLQKENGPLSAANVFCNTGITFQRRRPRGNIYHALALTFDSIADMRPQ